MEAQRKIIFETRVGSHLYGTNRPESDEDYCGIFLPSLTDVIGLQNCPTEWSMDVKNSTGPRNTTGDVDRKFYSLKQFLLLLAEGQSLQLEMLFSNRQNWLVPSRPQNCEWSQLIQNRELFLSKNSIMPFIGFAKAQAHKAAMKGDNLNKIRELIDQLTPFHAHIPLGHALNHLESEYRSSFSDTGKVHKDVITEGGIKAIEIAGKQYEHTQQIRYVLQKLRNIEKKYGSRSEAAAEMGYDYKSLLHAYRLLFEAKMLLTEGELRFPFPKEQVDFLISIRNGVYQTNFFKEIEDKLTELRELKEKSSLQESVDFGKIEHVHQTMLYQHLFKE